MKLFLDSPFSELWDGKDPFVEAFAIDGESYRDMGDRQTSRFEVNGRGYFIKAHSGVGLKEILKNLLYLRIPVVGAQNEFQAIERLHQLNVDTMTVAAFGKRGLNPAQQQSFIVTEALEPTVALDEFLTPDKLSEMGVAARRALVKKLAAISRTLHSNGVNHRDYYLCHFLLDTSPQYKGTPLHERPIYLIDLHRVQLRKRTPGRWRRKDLAGLWYSAKLQGFSARDALCFIREYEQKPLKSSFANPAFWQVMEKEAEKLFLKGERKGYHD